MCLDSCWAVWVICDSSRYSACLSVSFFMSVHFYESQCIAQPLFSCIHQHLPATAASKRQHSWDWSHLSEIYPAWSLGAQEGHRRPAHSQHFLLGLVAWQRWLIGLARLRKGLAWAGGIRSLPLIIFSLHSSESRGHGRKIKALPSCLRGGVITHTGERRETWRALCGCSVWHPIPHITVWCCDYSQSQVMWL